jgi:hypothetical protein
MQKSFLIGIALSISSMVYGQKGKQDFVATDIENFWTAYDKINSTQDSTLRLQYLREFYLNKGSDGLKSLVQVRHYSEEEFIHAITTYPAFWKSIRPNTLTIGSLIPDIEVDIHKLKEAYPGLKPSTIYFSVGAFRTGGTTLGNRVLIGSEVSLADTNTYVDELPEWRQPFYRTQHPIEELPLLCTHEYVHTQQEAIVEDLLSMCLYEGVAEFVSCKVTGKPSDVPAILFGKANESMVVQKFVEDLFLMSNTYNWLWGENRNELQVRDLGYYIGYEICERYYNLSRHKKKAIKELIELDFTDEGEVERIVDMSRLLPKPLGELNADYEKQRPVVIAMSPFDNGSQDVKPGRRTITITFSEPLHKDNTSVDFGPLGQDHFPKLAPDRYFNEEGTTWTIEAELQANQHYQILISNNFRKANGVRLKPYLIDFKTSE